MIIVDTSVWIAALNQQEKNHIIAEKFIEKIYSPTKNTYGILCVPWLVSQEVMTSILYSSSINITQKKNAMDQLWIFFTSEEVINEEKMQLDTSTIDNLLDLTQSIMLKYLSNRRPPSFVDCYQVIMANELAQGGSSDVYLATFDTGFPSGNYIPIL